MAIIRGTAPYPKESGWEMIPLDSPKSIEDIRDHALKPGDQVSLCDEFAVVTATLAIDPKHGLVGMPDPETFCYFDCMDDY